MKLFFRKVKIKTIFCEEFRYEIGHREKIAILSLELRAPRPAYAGPQRAGELPARLQGGGGVRLRGRAGRPAYERRPGGGLSR